MDPATIFQALQEAQSLVSEVIDRRTGGRFIEALRCDSCGLLEKLTEATMAGAVHYAEMNGWMLSEDGVSEADCCPSCLAGRR